MSAKRNLKGMLDEIIRLFKLAKEGSKEQANKKEEEIIDLMTLSPQIKRNFTRRDLSDLFLQIEIDLNKNLGEITKDELETYFNKLLSKTLTYKFFFPVSELRDFPDGFELGYGKLLSFGKLPEKIKADISYEWKWKYEKDKEYSRTFEEYKERKENEKYLCLEVASIGHGKAILLATEKANKSLGILKVVYQAPLSILRECSFLVEEKKTSGMVEGGGFLWAKHVEIAFLDQMIDQINKVFLKKDLNELEFRIKSSIATHGIIEAPTPLETKFLLTVISIEGLLVSENEKDYIGWKLREKIALLLGDSYEWLACFLNKNPKDITEQEVKDKLVDSRRELERRIKDLYNKRSQLAHLTVEKKEITEEDLGFAEWIYFLILKRLLDLRMTRGIDCIDKTKSDHSLNQYLDEIKYASNRPHP